MFKPQRMTTLTVCISLIVLLIASLALAESIGQKTMRLKREASKKDKSSSYTRGKFNRSAEKATDATEDKAADQDDSSKEAEVIVEAEEKPAKEVEVVVEARQPAKAIERTVINSNDPLTLIPGDALVCVQINNLGGTLSRLDQFLTGVSPFPLAMIANAQIGTLIGNPMVSGIDFNSNVIVFAKMPAGSFEPFIAFLIPVTKYEDFTTSNPNCSAADSDGVSTITPPNGMLGNLLSIEAPGGKYAIITQPTAKTALLQTVNSTSANSSLAAMLTVKEQKLSQQSPLWVYGNLETAAQMFMPMLDMVLQGVQVKVNQAVADSGGKVDPAAQAATTAMLKDTISQLKSLSITLTPVQDKLTLSVNLTAKDGSEFAKLLVADPAATKGFKLARYLKDPAAMNVLAKINKPLMAKIMNLLVEMMPADKDQMMAKVNDYIRENIDAFGNEMAYSLSPGIGESPFTIKQIQNVGDKAKIDELITLQLVTMHKMSQNTEPFKTDDAPHGRTMVYSMALPAPAVGAAPAMALPTVHVSAAKDMVLTCVGDRDEMLSFMDSTNAGPATPTDDIRTALRIVDNSDEMDFVASVNLLRMISVGSKAMEASPAAQVPQVQMISGMLSGLKGDSKSCIAIAGKIEKGTASTQVVIPKDHLMEIMAAFMQMQQQIQQQQMMQIQQIQNSSGDSK